MSKWLDLATAIVFAHCFSSMHPLFGSLTIWALKGSYNTSRVACETSREFCEYFLANVAPQKLTAFIQKTRRVAVRKASFRKIVRTLWERSIKKQKEAELNVSQDEKLMMKNSSNSILGS